MSNIPDNGLHAGIPADVYHAWPLPSSTLLNEMWRYSPAHALRRMSEPLDSASLRIGSALHTFVLEGEAAFSARFAWGGPINPRTGKSFGSDTDKFAEWAAEQSLSGKVCITQAEADAVRGMAAALIDHPSAYAHLIGTAEHREMSGVFNPIPDIAPGLRAKFRPDGIAPSFGALVDLKTTASANYWDFRSSIVNYGYHRQAALYLRGAQALGIDVTDFVFVVVEKEPPYAVGVYRLDLDCIGVADQQITDLLERWNECHESGEWPAYEDECITIDLPTWAKTQTYLQRRGTVDPDGGGW